MMIRARSLVTRLLLASMILLPLTLGATGWYLERAHRSALDAATVERLQLQVIALIAQAEVDEGFSMPLRPLEPRLAQLNSGLYAMVTDRNDQLLWLSPSANFMEAPVATLAAGVPVLRAGASHDSEGEGLFRHAYQVVWELAPGEEWALQFIVAETTAPRDADLATYRQQLLLWLGTTMLLLFSAQLAVVRWGLMPLRHLSHAIKDIEAGSSVDLQGPWPAEVRPLVDNLEALLAGEQRRRARLRNTLADLAHTLKTPLAVLSSADPEADTYPQLRNEQISRMQEVIAWQLQRASGGQGRPLQRVAISPLLERLRSTLLKVYAERNITLAIHCPTEARFQGDERDLLELMGNLLDNACKYGRHRVLVTVIGPGDGEDLIITVEDDGDGISPELRDVLLQRGARADTRREGQGIGLALVRELVESHRGLLEIEQSSLGGAQVLLRFPAF